jgi:hypothetical protein
MHCTHNFFSKTTELCQFGQYHPRLVFLRVLSILLHRPSAEGEWTQKTRKKRKNKKQEGINFFEEIPLRADKQQAAECGIIYACYC